MSKVEPGRKRPKTGGRTKGTPNKMTGALKEMILAALDKAGGVEYLVAQSRETPTAFLTLVGKVLPLQVGGDPENPLKMEHITRRIVDTARGDAGN